MTRKCRILYSWSILYRHTLRKFNYDGWKLFISTLVFIPLSLSAANASPVPIDLHHNPRTGRGDIMQMWTDEKFPGIMRNALKPDAQNRWIHYKDKKGNFIIPYEIAGTFSSAERKIIHGAMASIAKNTCIHFKKKKKDQFDYVEIQNKRGEGCYTMVGRNPGKNIVMLEANEEATCVLHETVVHELFHTIGLWHEQMRFDRDTYIKIHYENIPPAYYAQFKKVPEFQSTTYGVKYDYYSVMHYAKDAFAMIPGALTMQTKIRKAQDKIGHAKEASKGDYTKVCSIYNCPKCMRKPFKRGQKSGKNGKKHKKHRRHHRHRKLPNIFKILFDNPIANSTDNSNNNTSQQENISSNDTIDSSNTESDSIEDDNSGGDGSIEDSDSSDDSEDIDTTFFDEPDEKFRDISDTWTFEEAIEDILENANISIGGSNQTNIIIVADPNARGRYTGSQSDENNTSNSIDVMSGSEIQNNYSEENPISSDQNELQSEEAEQIRTVVMALPQPQKSTADESLEKSHKHHHSHHHGSHHSHKSQSSIENKSDQMIDQQNNGEIEQGNQWSNFENDENTWNEDNPNIQDVQAGDGADIRQSDEKAYDNDNIDNYDVQNHGDYNQIDYEDPNNFDGQNETRDQNGFDQNQFYDYGNYGEDEKYDDQDHKDDNQIDENDNLEYSGHKFETEDSDD